MAKNIYKLVTVAAICTILAIGFSACGNGDDPVTPDPQDAATPAPVVEHAPPPDDHDPRAYQPVPDGDWRTPFPYPVHITAAATFGIHWTFEGTDTVQDSPWTRSWANELNVHVEWEILEAVDYELVFQLAMAADNLPDVFYIPNAIQRTFHELQAAGMLLDLAHAYNNYASDRIRDREIVDPLTIQTFMVNGGLYALPRYYYGQIDQPWHIWVRKDWYEAEGSPEIRTVEDLENLARAFMANHGAHYGFAINDTLQYLFRTGPMFGVYLGDIHNSSYFWLPDETGTLIPGIARPEFITALENWQRWFAEGLISPEFMMMGEWDRIREDIANGVVGIIPWWQWWGWFVGPDVVLMQDNNDAYFIPLNLPTLDGSRPARGQIFFPNLGTIAANSNFQNPGAWMKILSLVDHMIFSPDAGLTFEQREYYFAGQREHAATPVFKMIDPQADLLQYIYINRALETGDASPLFTTGMLSKHEEILSWLEHRYPPSALGPFLQLGFPDSAYGRSQHLFDNGWVIENRMWGPPPEEFDAAGLTGDMILEEVMLIIMGVNPVSHFTDVVLPAWYAQGGQIKQDAVNLHFGG